MDAASVMETPTTITPHASKTATVTGAEQPMSMAVANALLAAPVNLNARPIAPAYGADPHGSIFAMHVSPETPSS
jgi:hypothetical protein